MCSSTERPARVSFVSWLCLGHFYDDCQSGMEIVRREVERLSAQHSRYQNSNPSFYYIKICARSDSLLRHYIANAWLAKLDTMAEPGPIDNSSVICQHGGVRCDRCCRHVLHFGTDKLTFF